MYLEEKWKVSAFDIDSFFLCLDDEAKDYVRKHQGLKEWKKIRRHRERYIRLTHKDFLVWHSINMNRLDWNRTFMEANQTIK